MLNLVAGRDSGEKQKRVNETKLPGGHTHLYVQYQLLVFILAKYAENDTQICDGLEPAETKYRKLRLGKYEFCKSFSSYKEYG